MSINIYKKPGPYFCSSCDGQGEIHLRFSRKGKYEEVVGVRGAAVVLPSEMPGSLVVVCSKCFPKLFGKMIQFTSLEEIPELSCRPCELNKNCPGFDDCPKLALLDSLPDDSGDEI